MKRTSLRRYTSLKAHKRIHPVSEKTHQRNALWRKIVIARGEYLIAKYGFLICEYSGERMTGLLPNSEDLDAGWGHHINRNRNECIPGNCFIVKYRYHSVITEKHLDVQQEGFEGRVVK